MSATQTVSSMAVARTIFERLNDHDAEELMAFVAEDVIEDWPTVGRLEGTAAVRDHFAAIFAAMPDWRITIERMAADGETVFVHWHAIGTFTGAPLIGLAATGRRIDLRGTDCFTIRDGKVTSNFVAYDGMSFAVQAGILPERGSWMDRTIMAMANLRTKVRRRRR